MALDSKNRADNYKHIFGPVPSRRLGFSLGIDMVPPKVCTYNCAYCECGKTTVATLERKEYVSADAIIQELDLFLATNPTVDVITFAGSGEPTLNTALPRIIDHVQVHYPQFKTAILTNGSLLHLPEVQDALLTLDYVLPSIDALSENTFKKINMPVPQISCSMVIEGITAFAKRYRGILWLEVFIIPGINDTEQELANLKKHIDAIKPTRVQLNTLDRPGVFSWVTPATMTRLQTIAEGLLPHPVEIIARKKQSPENQTPVTINRDHLLLALKRRPMTIEDIALSLKCNINNAQALLESCISDGLIVKKEIDKRLFYCVS